MSDEDQERGVPPEERTVQISGKELEVLRESAQLAAVRREDVERAAREQEREEDSPTREVLGEQVDEALAEGESDSPTREVPGQELDEALAEASQAEDEGEPDPPTREVPGQELDEAIVGPPQEDSTRSIDRSDLAEIIKSEVREGQTDEPGSARGFGILRHTATRREQILEESEGARSPGEVSPPQRGSRSGPAAEAARPEAARPRLDLRKLRPPPSGVEAEASAEVEDLPEPAPAPEDPSDPTRALPSDMLRTLQQGAQPSEPTAEREVDPGALEEMARQERTASAEPSGPGPHAEGGQGREVGVESGAPVDPGERVEEGEEEQGEEELIGEELIGEELIGEELVGGELVGEEGGEPWAEPGASAPGSAGIPSEEIEGAARLEAPPPAQTSTSLQTYQAPPPSRGAGVWWALAALAGLGALGVGLGVGGAVGLGAGGALGLVSLVSALVGISRR